ncbi:MAG TPA: hypothetical protein DCZ94_02190 [Lentisphaeria bacterium]|nr:MAG: hypothetical protein A2X48_19900 [Lentisphaerae bacterium GWF2_49_21]HBC85744.1 hypothetical protein [Lentisphaeria bacterium]
MKTGKWKIAAVMMFAYFFAASYLLCAQEQRQIKVIEDRDQTYMSSKVYELKSIKAADLTPFIQGAVKRYYNQSSVDRLSFPEGGKEFIAVNMPTAMVPFVDDMVAKLDRAGKVDENNSTVEGTGIYRFVYCPKYRASSEMEVIGRTITNGDGEYYFDASTSMFYWKDSSSYGNTSLEWFKAFDRPVPQVQLTLNVYEVTDDDLTELGIDYVAWKNGPGANIFNAGYDFLSSKFMSQNSSWSNMLNVSNMASHSWAGFLVAPNIDMTFIKLLAQKGKARIATSGSLTVVNDFTSPDPGIGNFDGAKYKLRFTPSYQNIQKSSDQNTSVDTADADFLFYIRLPVINFNDKGDKAAALEFGWYLNIMDTVEKVSNGTPIQNSSQFYSWTTLDAGGEKLLASYTKVQEVKQENGIPLLSDIPVLKYIFGSTNVSKSTSKVYVTVKAEAVRPESSLSEWAGRIVTAGEMLREGDKPGAEKKDVESKPAEAVKEDDKK